MPQEQTKVCVSVSDEKIMKLIHAAVAEKLAKNSEAIVSKVVEIALTAKKDHYSTYTIFEEHTHKMIREVAQEAFSEWLEKRRRVIKKAMRERLETDARVKGVVDSLVDGLKDAYYFNVNMKLEPKSEA